jgi:homoserine acetyltransferase
MRELAAGITAPCNLIELESIFGHDAFLKEVEALRPILVRALEGPS